MTILIINDFHCRGAKTRGDEGSRTGGDDHSVVVSYHQAYPSHLHFMRAPHNWMVPDIYKFSIEDSKSTMEHISLFHTQMGEASTFNFMKVYSFPLSFTSTVFLTLHLYLLGPLVLGLN